MIEAWDSMEENKIGRSLQISFSLIELTENLINIWRSKESKDLSITSKFLV